MNLIILFHNILQTLIGQMMIVATRQRFKGAEYYPCAYDINHVTYRLLV